jgi:hypothetical protein
LTATVVCWPLESTTGQVGCETIANSVEGSVLTPLSSMGPPEPEWTMVTVWVPDCGTLTCGGLKVISGVPPAHSPEAHVPPETHALALEQEEPSAALTSAGHWALVPVQLSAESHCPPAGRQTVVDGRNESAGQLADVPVQFSALSHGPFAGRQTVVDGRNESAGQSADVPVQFSALSQSPAAARHGVVAGLNVSTGQAVLAPVQNSAWSQSPFAARHSVPDG